MTSRRRPQNNFAYLLVGLLMLLVLPASLRLFISDMVEVGMFRAFLLGGFSLFTIISVWSLYRDRWIFHFGLTLASLNIVIALIALFMHSIIMEFMTFMSVIIFSALSSFIAGRHVFSLRDTDTNSLIGAVCVYLLIGLIFALVYTMFVFFWPQDAFQGLTHDNNKAIEFDNFLYFSFVTLTTAGYGDITPLNPMLRTIAYLEMIFGQFYMAILVSGLVAHFMGSRISK